MLTTAVLSSLSVAFFYSAKRKQPKHPVAALPKSVEEMAATASNLAVARARSRWAIQLDYTPKSIQVVEMILAQLHETFKAEPGLVDVNAMAFIFGAYIGETMRRNHHGCFWQHDFDCYPLHYGETTCFPMAWCTTRIAVGSAENVWSKYQMLTKPQQLFVVPQAPKAHSAAAGAC
jgi:hypothetical protein